MKQCILFMTLAGILLPVAAQNDDLVLRQYKNRFQQYRLSTLSLDGSTSGQVEGSAKTFMAPGYFANTNSRYRIQGWYNRLYFSNTDRLQMTRYLSAGNYSNWSGSSSNQREWSANTSISTQQEMRYYRNELKFLFFGFSLGASDNRMYSQPGNNNPGTYANYQYWGNGLRGSLNLGAGKGRLEVVSDAAFALFWLQDMQAKGVIAKYTDADAQKIAEAITRMRNTRIMDFRFRTIDQALMMDTAFQNSGILNKVDGRYYATLYDHYLYANNIMRMHGRRWDYGISVAPEWDYNYNINRLDTAGAHYSYTSFNLNNSSLLYALRTVNLAQSLHHQFNYYYGAKAGLVNEAWQMRTHFLGYTDAEYGLLQYTGMVDLGIAWGWYYNTRNYMELSLHGSHESRRDAYDPIWMHEQRLQAALRLYHWFSPNFNASFSINGRASIIHDKGPTYRQSRTNLNQYASFGLGYNFY